MGAQRALITERRNIVFKIVIVAKRFAVLGGGDGLCKRSE